MLIHLHFCMAVLEISMLQLKLICRFFFTLTLNWTTVVMQSWSVRSMVISEPQQSGQLLLFLLAGYWEKLSSYFQKFGSFSLQHQCMLHIRHISFFPCVQFHTEKRGDKAALDLGLIASCKAFSITLHSPLADSVKGGRIPLWDGEQSLAAGPKTWADLKMCIWGRWGFMDKTFKPQPHCIFFSMWKRALKKEWPWERLVNRIVLATNYKWNSDQFMMIKLRTRQKIVVAVLPTF